MTQFFDLFVPPASVRSSLAFNLAQTVPKPPAIVRTVCFILGACSMYGWWWPNVPGRPSENFGPMFSVVRFWRGTFRTFFPLFHVMLYFSISHLPPGKPAGFFPPLCVGLSTGTRTRAGDSRLGRAIYLCVCGLSPDLHWTGWLSAVVLYCQEQH